jgi:alanyl-tRNA synthetase
MMPTASTRVTYPEGVTDATARVVAAVPYQAGCALFTDTTPFHPLDHTWPDQPADRGMLQARAGEFVVRDVIMAAADRGKTDNVMFGADITARRGDPAWDFYVAHLVSEKEALDLVDQTVQLKVDTNFRHALSASHTACHLMAFALNRACARYWKKDVEKDTIGSPNFDKVAIQRSSIGPNNSTDDYRIGKSLRKSGLDAATLVNELPAIETYINTILNDWIARSSAIVIERSDDTVAARRWWTCNLPDGIAKVPCGGTHLANLDEIATVVSSLAMFDEHTLRIVTRPTLNRPAGAQG